MNKNEVTSRDPTYRRRLPLLHPLPASNGFQDEGLGGCRVTL